MNEPRPTVLFNVEPDAPAVRVYADEEAALRSDALLYGNVYVKPDPDGTDAELIVYVRIDPRHVHPERSDGS
jgi:hypothetical protein